jgi:hypothetical protein
VKLQSFWPNSPAAWFNNAEAQFIVRDITDPVDKYYLVAASLNEQQSDMVHHILESEVTADSYERLRNALVASHSLTNFQKVDRLVTMEPLGGRKPSELMAAMERLKPPSDGHFFVYHFLQRLPREVRILLADEDPANTRKLAEKADQLMALHQPQVHDVAAVSTAASSEGADCSEATVAAAAAASRSGQRQQQKKKWKKPRAKRGSSPAEGWQSPLCYFHVRYGDKAHRCEEPCAWPGN